MGIISPPNGVLGVLALLGTALVSLVAFADERQPEEKVHRPVDSDLHRPSLARSVPPYSVAVEEYAPGETSLNLNLPTHIFFGHGIETISEVLNDRLTFRRLGSISEWIVSPIPLNGPHAVAFSNNDSQFYSVDSDNSRIVSFANPDEEIFESAYAIAGFDLTRPHDIVFDDATGFLYALNPQPPVLLRMTGFGEDEDLLDLSHLTGYSRGLTLCEGTVFVAASNTGEVIEIVDFDSGEVIIHPSFGKLVNTSAGSWDTTGFIINDVEFYDGYWYLSNFFSPNYANGTDHNLFKLIRFRTWDDLEIGNWEDLSHLIDDGQIPYFFTLHEGSLYLAAFHGNHIDDAIYRLTSGLYFNDFESGDFSGWS